MINQAPTLKYNSANLKRIVIFSLLSLLLSFSLADAVTDTGKALLFDGINDYIDFEKPENLKIQTFSVSLWVKPASYLTNYPPLVSWGKNGWGVGIEASTGKVHLGKPWVAGVLSTGTISLGDWSHLVFICEDVGSTKRVKMYINGEYAGGSDSFNQVFTFTNAWNKLRVGTETDGTTWKYFTGNIDEVRIYNRVLSEAEIGNLYNQEHVFSSLITYWSFDEGTGNVANDSIGTNNGTIYGATWTEGVPIPPVPPTGLNVVKINNTTTLLTWSQNQEPDFAEYRLYANNVFLTATTNLEYQDTNIPSGTRVYTLRAVDIAGNQSEPSIPVAITLRPGKALEFDGIDDYISIPHSNVFNFGGNNFTISLWAKFASTSGARLYLGRNGASDRSWSFYYMNGNLRFAWQGYNYHDEAFAWTPLVNTWYLITVVRNSSDLKVFVNDIQVGSTYNIDSDVIRNASSDFYIAENVENRGYYFNGTIDEILIYKRALSEAEIRNLYNQEHVLSSLVTYWSFDEGTGNIANDSIGTNNGTIYGATWTEGVPLVIDTIPPATPTGLKLVGINNTTTLLTWNPNQEPDFAEYRLYANNVFLTATTNLEYQDTNIPSGTRVYTLKAVDIAGNQSGPSIPVAIILDSTPPTVKLIPSSNFHISEAKNYAPLTFTYVIEAIDESGVDHIEVNVDEAGFNIYTQPISFSTERIHTIVYKAMDNYGNWSVPKSITIYVDKIAPDVNIISSKLIYTDGAFHNYASSDYNFTFSATDILSGVKQILVNIDQTGFISYVSPISFITEGTHIIEYKAEDNVGNIGTSITYTVIITNTPLITKINIGVPQYGQEPAYITSNTPITLNVEPAPVPVKSTEHSVNGLVWITYLEPFTITQQGTFTLKYRSVNQIDVVEPVKSISLFIDDIPPISNLTPNNTLYFDGQNYYGLPSYSYTLSATDEGSGVNKIFYKINEGQFSIYAEPLTFTAGTYTITHKARDNLGNEEIEKVFTIIVTESPPILALIPSHALYFNAVNYFSSLTTTFTITVSNPLIQVDRIEVNIDDTGFVTYTQPISFATSGLHSIEYRPIQNGQYGTSKIFQVIIDVTSPDTRIVVGTPKHNSFVNITTQFTLLAEDELNGSGVAYTEYSLDKGQTWIVYAKPFTFSNPGHQTIQYRSIDNVKNIELFKEILVSVDITFPSTNLIPSTPFISDGKNLYAPANTTYSLIATDDEAGVERSQYYVDQDEFINYTTPFSLSVGSRTVYYRSIDYVGNVEQPASKTILVVGLPPEAPTDLNAQPASTTSINLSWAKNPEFYIASYNLYRNNEQTPINSILITALSYQDKGLVAGQTYTYTLTAVDKLNRESQHSLSVSANPQILPPVISLPTTATIPKAVTTATITVAGNAEPDASIEIFVNNIAKGTTITQFDGVFRLNNIPVELGDNFIIAKGTLSGTTANSQPISIKYRVPLVPPTNVQLVADDTVIHLNWNQSISSNIIGYRIYRNGSERSLNAVLIQDTKFSDIGLSNGKDYSYTVTAVDDVGLESNKSTEISTKPVAKEGW